VPCRNTRAIQAGFTLTEVLLSLGLLGIFAAGLMTTWTALGTSVVNTTAYAERQNDQMRVFDYLKRDIRRATSVGIYSGGVLVTGTNFGDELRLTIPDYYTDSREEDNAIGPRVASTPTLTSGSVTYGALLTVRYFVSNGAVIRDESGTLRTLADSAGAFTLSFSNDASGLVRCRVFFNQLLRSGSGRVLRRQVDILCGQRAQLQS
jgi:prepilin-type N-terminal cleavage/methylation domain-containing protein